MLICCFTACTADGLLAAIRSAVSSAHGISRSAGTTRLIEPQARGLLGVDEPAGQQQLHRVDVADLLDELDRRAAERDRSTSFTSGSPKRAWGAAARMSVESRSSTPPPAQSPLTAATMGLV